jgi:hypothetical protein
MLYAFLGGWVPRDDGCCTLFQVGGSPDGGKGTVTYLPWERNATQARGLPTEHGGAPREPGGRSAVDATGHDGVMGQAGVLTFWVH